MPTFTKTLRTIAPTAPDVYVTVVERGNATPVVARTVMARETSVADVGTSRTWVVDVSWELTWDNPAVIYDDGVELWGGDENSLANVVEIEGAGMLQASEVSASMARVVGRQYGAQEIHKNDTYSVAAGGELEFVRASTSEWPTISGAGWSCKLYLTQQRKFGTDTLTVTTCTIVDDNTVTVAMTASETDSLGVGQYDYQLRAEHVTSGNRTLESGVLVVKPEQVP